MNFLAQRAVGFPTDHHQCKVPDNRNPRNRESVATCYLTGSPSLFWSPETRAAALDRGRCLSEPGGRPGSVIRPAAKRARETGKVEGRNSRGHEEWFDRWPLHESRGCGDGRCGYATAAACPVPTLAGRKG